MTVDCINETRKCVQNMFLNIRWYFEITVLEIPRDDRIDKRTLKTHWPYSTGKNLEMFMNRGT